jgi:SAM-dependent methyltransferase
MYTDKKRTTNPYNTPVDDKVRDQLLDLNRTFYQTFAQPFSATRQRLQPGILRVLELISSQHNVLDLGCGNGQLGIELISRGHEGLYVGLDSNPELLEIAREKLGGQKSVSLQKKDLTTVFWDDDLPAKQFDFILAFAVLHHVPGAGLRQNLVEKIKALSPPGGRFIHSEWQLLNSPRLRERIQPWGKVGLNSSQVERGDYLIDWRRGGQGLRYVHVFSVNELETIAQGAGFQIMETFMSDGEGGKLGMYQIWKGV